MIINIQDDYQSVLFATDATPSDVTPSPDFAVSIVDEFGAQLVYSATPYHATPSSFFAVRIVDEFGDTPDEWVLITEDGLVISIEPSDDEFGITVE